MGSTCWIDNRCDGMSTKPPVPGVEASTKDSEETHRALPVVVSTWVSDTPLSRSLPGST